jgi:hypothetical protein
MGILGGKLRQSDRHLAHGEEPPLGAHLVTPRLGFAHHGIYVGDGKVVHYGTLGKFRLGGPMEEASLAAFARGHGVWIRCHDEALFSCTEVIRRARSRIGEDGYRVLTNNCEHFCEWCLQGEPRSYQVDTLLSLTRRLERAISALAS